ncbi:MAG TPA: NrfD/PsrC family molybdoenzyme membrane anchor subunit [Ruania sp.]|nr:NrfD/PsrC family molybdoenzyme membrane anchor subunit [Ruania sp.]
MSTSEFDSYRPPEPEGGRRRRKGRRRAGPSRGGGDGSREMPVVPDAAFGSYYGRPVVKAPPWETDVAAYLFLGGLAAGSGLLAAGAQLTGREALRRSGRLAAITAAGLGAGALVRDLGRPERFLNMLRTVKLTSPMSVGSWILAGFSTCAGVAAADEVDRATGSRLPLGRLRGLLRGAGSAAGLGAGALAPPLAAYTAVLLSDTAVPTWNEAREELPFVFVSSASLAAGGLAMITTPVAQAGPARVLAVVGAAGELLSAELLERRMDETVVETLHQGRPGTYLRVSKALAAAGGLGALLAGRWRTAGVLSGTALLVSSALTRLGYFEAGLASAKDPKYTVEPQKRRLAERRRRGITDDSITTGP